jgi:hypothetical protein
MSRVFDLGDKVTVRGKQGGVNVDIMGEVYAEGLLENDFTIKVIAPGTANDSKLLHVLSTNISGADPNPKVTGIDGFVAYKNDIVKSADAGAPTAPLPKPSVPPRPSAPTLTGPIPGRPIAAASSVFKLTSRPVGRRSYDIDTAVAPAVGSTPVPPPVFRSTDSTLSFLTPRKPGCATKAAGAV